MTSAECDIVDEAELNRRWRHQAYFWFWLLPSSRGSVSFLPRFSAFYVFLSIRFLIFLDFYLRHFFPVLVFSIHLENSIRYVAERGVSKNHRQHYLRQGCLSVSVSITCHKNYWSIFMTFSPETYLWPRKNWLNLQSHPRLDTDVGIFWLWKNVSVLHENFIRVVPLDKPSLNFGRHPVPDADWVQAGSG